MTGRTAGGHWRKERCVVLEICLLPTIEKGHAIFPSFVVGHDQRVCGLKLFNRARLAASYHAHKRYCDRRSSIIALRSFDRKARANRVGWTFVVAIDSKPPAMDMCFAEIEEWRVVYVFLSGQFD